MASYPPAKDPNITTTPGPAETPLVNFGEARSLSSLQAPSAGIRESSTNPLGPLLSREPSIRIRRPSVATHSALPLGQDEVRQYCRRRSSSEPQRLQSTLDAPGVALNRERTTATIMPAVVEEDVDGMLRNLYPAVSEQPQASNMDQPSSDAPIRTRPRGISRLRRSVFGRQRSPAPPGTLSTSHEYGSSAVDLLDVVDREVSTLSTLTNVQNSLFVPNLGRYVNRRPSYELTPVDTVESLPTVSDEETVEKGTETDLSSSEHSRQRKFSISSDLDESHYAVLPHLFSVDDWREEDIRKLNDHVRHQLHSRRAKFKRSMRGFRKYVSKPLGFAVTLYATLITIFGLVWVLFIIGWLSAGERSEYVTNIVDNVLVALFAIVGDGLAPFRAVDTYHMCFIAHYHRLTWRLRAERDLPPLNNENDLPSALPKPEAEDVDQDDDIENAAALTRNGHAEFSILRPEQQKKLEHHQAKFAKSHSFYKAHETTTHNAFPLRMLVAAVVLLDCHSILQIMLGSFTWGWSYHTRPSWITAVILSISITVNISAGIVITVGDRMTRKGAVIEKMYRQNLTEEGIKKLRKNRRKRAEEDRRGRIEGVKFSHEHKHSSHERPRFSLDIGRHKSG